MLTRALCVGGSWAGHYREFDVRRGQTTFELSPRPKQITTPYAGDAPNTETVTQDVYEVHSVEFAEGERLWIAAGDRMPLRWALQQLMFVYARDAR